MTTRTSPSHYAPVDTYTAPDLGGAPEVERLLNTLGQGRYDRSTVVALPGRNDTWAGRTTTGAEVFVKRLAGPPEHVRARMARALAFEDLPPTATDGRLRGPHLLGHDPQHGLLAFEYISGARSGTVLATPGAPDAPEAARRLGTALGLLHGLSADTDPGGRRPLERELPLLPSPVLLDALPLALYERSSAGELQAWRLMQTDNALAPAVTALLAAERAAPAVPIHGDFRLDQVLLVDGEPSVLAADWEEFRLGDAARDVGGFAGEFLHRTVLETGTPEGDDSRAQLADAVLTRDEVLQRGAIALAGLRPVVRAFWQEYLRARPDADPSLGRRAAAFAGWHALDRLLAGAARRNRLLGVEKAAAGVGRSVLLDPDRYAPAIGLEGNTP
ncbi:class V lanthionine synthetase subunit LxmK [Streptomyces sp. NPDC056441]|uniref:class V lanthionine synthetase subunit LxmK n=1 Tax=Streptomyces sp. NPDC056441 TaxID=3345817 RepID=UPI00368F1576